jgi:hypothetical protein
MAVGCSLFATNLNPQLITYQAKMYVANCCAHISVNLPHLLRSYVKCKLRHALFYAYLPADLMSDLLDLIIGGLEDGNMVLDARIMARIRQANPALVDHVSATVLSLAIHIRDNILRGHRLSKEIINRNWWKYLSTMLLLRQNVEKYNGKSAVERVRACRPARPQRIFSILPVPNFQQKHIFIDTRGLYNIMRHAGYRANGLIGDADLDNPYLIPCLIQSVPHQEVGGTGSKWSKWPRGLIQAAMRTKRPGSPAVVRGLRQENGANVPGGIHIAIPHRVADETLTSLPTTIFA